MKTITRNIGISLVAAAMAVGTMCPSTASAEKIRTPFAGMPEATMKPHSGEDRLSKLKSQMKAPVLNSPKEGVASDFGPLWSSDMTMADAEAECDDSQLVRLADGGYIAVYTCGAGGDIFEGRIVRLAPAGDKLWESVIQPGFNTTVSKVCQGSDGRFYVVGSTQRDGLMQSFIACFDGDGNQVYMTVNEDNIAVVYAKAVETIGNKVAMVYSTNSSWGSKNLVVRWYDEEGHQTHEITRSVTTATTEYTSRLGDFLMVPMYGDEAFAFDLKNATIALHISLDEGLYLNGCSTDDAIYTLHRSSSSKLVLTQYMVDGSELTEKWSCTTEQEQNGYDSFAFSLNEGRVLIYNKKINASPGIAIINSDGSIYKNKQSVNFGDLKEAWAYAGAQDADGKIYLFGMTGNGIAIGLTILTTDAELNDPQGVIYNQLDPGYSLYYSQYDRSYYADGEFVFSGYMRPEDYWEHGYTPMFGTYDITETDMKILCTGIPGKIANVEPSGFAVDSDKNVYVAGYSGVSPVLVKYNALGDQEWVNYPDKGGSAIRPVVLANGNVCSITRYDNGIRVVCYTSDGKMVFNTIHSVEEGDVVIYDAYSIEGSNNSVIIAAKGYSSVEGMAMPYLIKVDINGKITARLVRDFDTGSNVQGITRDTEGNVYILGDNTNQEDIACPMILKINDNLETLKAFVQEIDVVCPLYYGEIDADGNIYVVGNTWYHGMLFVYDREFNLVGYHIYDTTMAYRTVYDSLSITSEGNALIAVSFTDENWNSSSKIICYNENAEMKWQYDVKNDDDREYSILDAAQCGTDILAVGCVTTGQDYMVQLNAEREIIREYVSSLDYGYNGYCFIAADIINGDAYVASYHNIGRATVGNMSCFESGSSVNVEDIFSNDSESSIVIYGGSAHLADGSSALWTVFTVDGRKVLETSATEVNLNGLPDGMYIISANNSDVSTARRLIK